jgi:hypothetical protein
MTTNSTRLAILSALAAAAIGSTAYAAQSGAAVSDQRKICLRDSVTGSRIERSTCKTVGEWRNQLSAEEFEKLRKLAKISTSSSLASASNP